MFPKTIIFLSIFYLGNADNLTCYQCDPRSPGTCESPDKNGINTTVCKENVQTTNPNEMAMTKEINEMNLNSTEPPFCYYLYLDAGVPEQTGYYRGCSKMSEGLLEFCKALREKMHKMIGCETCNSTECNNGNFHEMKTKTPRSKTGKSLIGDNRTAGSGSISPAVSKYLAFINIVIIFCFLCY